MIKNYADENGYTFSDYPQSLVDLLKRNKETKEFVLNYPKYKDKHFKINMKEYKNCHIVTVHFIAPSDIPLHKKRNAVAILILFQWLRFIF